MTIRLNPGFFSWAQILRRGVQYDILLNGPIWIVVKSVGEFHRSPLGHSNFQRRIYSSRIHSYTM